jgi:hypothetical protein
VIEYEINLGVYSESGVVETKKQLFNRLSEFLDTQEKTEDDLVLSATRRQSNKNMGKLSGE